MTKLEEYRKVWPSGEISVLAEAAIVELQDRNDYLWREFEKLKDFCWEETFRADVAEVKLEQQCLMLKDLVDRVTYHEAYVAGALMKELKKTFPIVKDF
jgi:hypothetical protein